MTALTDTKTEKVAELILEFHRSPIKNLLVVGCGAGMEAAILAQRLDAKVTGIDLRGEFDPIAAQHCELRIADATELEFENESFDFVFSYHALEHINDPVKALLEIRRVLKPDGGFWIGTPNKSRIIGYIGGKNTSFSEKLKWNFTDWKIRFAGKFENKYGAHAGFKSGELQSLLASLFSKVDTRTSEYFLAVYSSKRGLVQLINASGLAHRIYPSVYFSGVK
ncbi:MAG: class I SAM-dependent methyltransferase [Blastocatellia bacterium]